MTLYCPDWTDHLTDTYPSHTFEDGDDCDGIFLDAGCNSFEQRGSFYLDRDGDRYDSSADEYDSPRCTDHDRVAGDASDYSVRDALESAGFFVCDDDDETYHDLDAYNQHRVDEHGADDEDEDETPRPTYWNPTVPSTHSTWIST
jgi:hypothetical protein